MPCPRTEIAGWRLTHHAQVRMAEHGFSEPEIRAALDLPEVSYTQSDYGDLRQVRQQGRVAVVVNQRTHDVITVLFRSPADWQRRGAFGSAA